MRRVFSLWQPWASLCVLRDPCWHDPRPAKQYETRHWAPRQPLPIDVVIHATKKYLPPLEGSLMRKAMDRSGTGPVPRGAIIGVATIVEVVPTEKLVTTWWDNDGEIDADFEDEFEFGDYRYGRFAWRMEGAIALPKPIEFRGRQEPLYQLDPAIEKLVNEQLEEAKRAPV